MISITFNASSKKDLDQQLQTWLGSGGVKDVNPVLPEDESAPMKRGPGRPKKVDAPVPAAPPQPEGPLPPVAAPTEHAAPSLDTVKQALRKVAEHRPGDKGTTDGITRISTILQSVGVITVKELKPEQYHIVLNACAAA